MGRVAIILSLLKSLLQAGGSIGCRTIHNWWFNFLILSLGTAVRRVLSSTLHIDEVSVAKLFRMPQGLASFALRYKVTNINPDTNADIFRFSNTCSWIALVSFHFTKFLQSMANNRWLSRSYLNWPNGFILIYVTLNFPTP